MDKAVRLNLITGIKILQRNINSKQVFTKEDIIFLYDIKDIIEQDINYLNKKMVKKIINRVV